MAVDESSARIDRLEAQIRELNETTRRALEQGRPQQAERSQESVQDILARLDPEERRLIEDHRAYEQYKRLRSRRIQEEEKEKLLKKAQVDPDDDGDDDGDDDDAKPKAKPKKAKPRPKPASRHADDDGDDSDDDAKAKDNGAKKESEKVGFFGALMKD